MKSYVFSVSFTNPNDTDTKEEDSSNCRYEIITFVLNHGPCDLIWHVK